MGGARAGEDCQVQIRSARDSVGGGKVSDYVFWEVFLPRIKTGSVEGGALSFGVRGVEGAGLRWRGWGGALRLELAAVPPERREARSALARALAAGLGGGAAARAAGFPRRDPEGSDPGDRVGSFAQGRCWGPRQSVGLAVCDAVV